MSIDYRALCEELIDALESNHQTWRIPVSPLVARARAALAVEADGPAVPESRESASVVGEPSDDELLELSQFHCVSYTLSNGSVVSPFVEGADIRSEVLSFARAAISRYGHQPAPPAEGEVGELVAWIRGMYWAHPDKKRATRAADLLEQRHPTPVPVAERLPSASHVYFEFVISDADDCTQAGGIAPTYAQALSEGQHYLAQFHQDGPHTLELRRVEVLHSDAPLLPAGKAAKLHPAPVPVSERLPGPEDCDADGQVWVSHERLPWDEFICWTLMTMDKAKMWAPVAFWLPATALPLPAGEVQP